MVDDPKPPRTPAPKDVASRLDKLTRDLDALEKETVPPKPDVPPVGGMI